jgi:hypothetical protein
MTSTSKLRTPLLALFLAALLGVSAVACSSDDDSATTTTAADVTTTTADDSDDSDDTTTTTADDSGAECTAEALALAGSASGPQGNFDNVTNFGCEDGWAWAWLDDSSGATTDVISEIFEDQGGEWTSVGDALCDGTAGSTAPTEVITQGCAYFGS